MGPVPFSEAILLDAPRAFVAGRARQRLKANGIPPILEIWAWRHARNMPRNGFRHTDPRMNIISRKRNYIVQLLARFQSRGSSSTRPTNRVYFSAGPRNVAFGQQPIRTIQLTGKTRPPTGELLTHPCCAPATTP
jgi:hypothetical protein